MHLLLLKSSRCPLNSALDGTAWRWRFERSEVRCPWSSVADGSRLAFIAAVLAVLEPCTLCPIPSPKLERPQKELVKIGSRLRTTRVKHECGGRCRDVRSKVLCHVKRPCAGERWTRDEMDEVLRAKPPRSVSASWNQSPLEAPEPNNDGLQTSNEAPEPVLVEKNTKSCQSWRHPLLGTKAENSQSSLLWVASPWQPFSGQLGGWPWMVLLSHLHRRVFTRARPKRGWFNVCPSLVFFVEDAVHLPGMAHESAQA